jgi:hypothetical protein
MLVREGKCPDYAEYRTKANYFFIDPLLAHWIRRRVRTEHAFWRYSKKRKGFAQFWSEPRITLIWTQKVAILAMAKAQAFPTSIGDPAAIND